VARVPARQTGVAKPGGPRFKFISETVSELKKVVWLSRREVVYLTILVLIVSGVAGAILGVLDYGFTRLVDKLFLGR
jgi:preprotein translocase subunit SecE